VVNFDPLIGQTICHYRIVEKLYGGVDNIWLQPLDGSKARPITNFTSEQIGGFARPSDDKRLVVGRSQSVSDVILLRDSSP
jgi:hypothetical protein